MCMNSGNKQHTYTPPFFPSKGRHEFLASTGCNITLVLLQTAVSEHSLQNFLICKELIL